MIALAACGQGQRVHGVSPASSSPSTSSTAPTSSTVPPAPTATEPWDEGDLAVLPPLASLEPLPGAPTGPPVFTSNNPETFTSTGFLYECARTDPGRGGASWPLSGDFGVYLHHDDGTGAPAVVQLVITNPGGEDLTVSGSGSGYSNGQLPLARGTGPDYAVALDRLAGTPAVAIPPTVVGPLHAAAVWSSSLAPGQYVDARFDLSTTAPAYVYAVATATDDVNEAVALAETAADGNIDPPGDPPPPFGREAGIYAHDTWSGAWSVAVPGPGHRQGYALDTALGGGFAQDQAFAALTALADSSTESVGDYGDLYDLAISLEPGDDAAATVEVWIASYGGGTPSFWLNGPVWVDGAIAPLWLAPDAPAARLATVDVPGEVHLELPIPGLASIPFGLFLLTP